MATSYPNGIDQFYEPLQPESTALSQVGGQASPGRNHVEHHRDLGDAVTALETYAAIRSHDHSGNSGDPTRGGKLTQANTHQNADTDSSGSALHHTLGTGAHQAAPGNHTHDYNDGSITSTPYILCTSTTRPASPYDGLTVYETDTNRMRVWNDFGNGNGYRWNILPTANIPIVRLAQTGSQNITSSGVAVRWDQELEDNFAFFTPGTSQTNIVVTEPGVYQIDAAVQWGVNFIPEVATVVVAVNGQETVLRHSNFQTPNLLSMLGVTIGSDYSQTVATSGKLRIGNGGTVSLRCRFSGITPIGTLINTYIDAPSNVKSRLEMHYVGP